MSFADRLAAIGAEADALEAQLVSVTAARDEWERNCRNWQRQHEAHMATYHPIPTVTDDFTDLAGWTGAFHGALQYAQQGMRLRSNVECADGILTVHTRPTATKVTLNGITVPAGGWTGGGLEHRTVLEPGCRVTLDLRMDASVGTRAVALLWPHTEPWPAGGELDFVENGGDIPDRQSTAITNHWAGPDGRNAQRVIKFAHDFTDWTPVEVVWDDEGFRVIIDDILAAEFTDHVPATPMKLAIQTAVAGGGHGSTFKGETRTPGRIQVRRLRIY